MALVRAALRRQDEPASFVRGDLATDSGRRRVSLGASAVELATTESELLRVLWLNARRVVT